MSEETVLVNELSREGVRTMHVVGMKRPNRAGWVERLPACAVESLEVCEWVDEMEIGHLVMVWNAREVVELREDGASRAMHPTKKAEYVPAIMWWIGPRGARMSEAIREGCERFFLDLGKDAQKVVVAKLPKGAPVDGRVKVEVLGREVEVELVERWWAPRNSVVLVESEVEWMKSG